jgi:uncharacterized protein
VQETIFLQRNKQENSEVSSMKIMFVLFNDVEELDFVGPYEALSYVNKVGYTAEIYTVSQDGEAVRCANGLRVLPDYSFESAPEADWLIVPGGQGRKKEMHNPAMLAFIARAAKRARVVASVCTGAFILVAAGVLTEGKATTYHLALEELKDYAPGLFVTGERVVRCNNIYSAGGVSAGIDLALQLADLIEPGLGNLVAEKIEYEQRPTGDTCKKVNFGGSEMRIGVLSDTHIPNRARQLPPSLFKIFDGVDLILHAGDLVTETVLAELAAIAPVEAVAGNMDPYLLSARLGRQKIINAGGFNIGLVHGDLGDGYDRGRTPQRVLEAFAGENVDCIVFGHSHQTYNREKEGVLLFNPGSPTDPRHSKGPSCGLLTLGKEIKAEIIYLP